MKIKDITESIGSTPCVRVNHLFPSQKEVWIKLETQNPSGSIKDRIAFSMIQKAENQGLLKKGMLIVEATSGNTGIGLAMIAAVKGYKLILVMPENMTHERKKIFKAYGAGLVLTPANLGMTGALQKAREISIQSNAWMPDQFENDQNREAHGIFTAKEILNDFPAGIDILVAGIGTSGHITGLAKTLRNHFPSIKIYGVEPSSSSVLSGSLPGPHSIQGIGAGFIPRLFNRTLLEDIIPITDSEAFHWMRMLAEKEGIFAGPSTGANLAAIHALPPLNSQCIILTLAYDRGDKYLTLIP